MQDNANSQRIPIDRWSQLRGHRVVVVKAMGKLFLEMVGGRKLSFPRAGILRWISKHVTLKAITVV